MCAKPEEYQWFCAFYRCNQPFVFCFSSTAFCFEQWRRRLRCFFLNFVVRVFEVSRCPFRKFVFGWTSDGEVSRGWFRLLVFEVSRGPIRNLIFDVQKLDWTSGGEVSRGRIRIPTFMCSEFRHFVEPLESFVLLFPLLVFKTCTVDRFSTFSASPRRACNEKKTTCDFFSLFWL